MPVPTIAQLKDRESSIKKRLADKAKASDPTKVRRLKKRLRRAQRRRREEVAVAAKRAKPEAATSAEAPAAG